MKQQDKELLFKDLSARLFYHTYIELEDGYAWLSIDRFKAIVTNQFGDNWKRPYLRPMSSMTEEEYNELEVLAYGCDCVLYTSCFPVRCNAKFKTYNLEVIDWLNAHHFDYRGLIEKGLALKAPERMYNEN